ncbi:hypothetical protein [Kiloniella sp.]|uniref:hypothetical protein n=1 Tax=Kiloniella sp. TaxID=1938587 RepID=UPI003B02D0E4
MENIKQKQHVTRETIKTHEAGYWDQKKEAWRLIEKLGTRIWRAETEDFGFYGEGIDFNDPDRDALIEEQAQYYRDREAECEGWKAQLRANPMVVKIYQALGCGEDMFIDCDKHPSLFPYRY